jgi:hypothetical protein
MDPSVQRRIAVNTLHEILDELDYYRLLQIDPDCVQGEIEPASRVAAREHHPDRISAMGDSALSAMATEIFQRVKEATEHLSDPDKRTQYDEIMKTGILRMTEEALAIAEKERLKADNPEHAASDPKAEKYWHMGLKDWEDKNYKGCVMNIQFALSFEPDNEIMKGWLDKAKVLASKESKATKNPYKLRIV